MMRLLIYGLIVGGAFVAGIAAHATPIANGAGAAAYVRDCRSQAVRDAGGTVPDRCIETDGTSFAGTMVQFVEVARPGATSAAAAVSHPLGINAGVPTQSSIDVAGDAGVLTLRQGAFTGAPYARVSGHSLGLQSFHYDGSGPALRTLLGRLDFTGTALTSQAGFDAALDVAAAYGYTQIDVFSLAAGSFDFTDPGFFWSGMFYAAAEATGADFRYEGSAFGSTTGLGELTTRLDLTMEAGRWYFVQSYLGLFAKFGGQFDATHTFTTELGIVDPASGIFARSLLGLTPSAASVPEPQTLVLLLAGAFAATALARRRTLRVDPPRPPSRGRSLRSAPHCKKDAHVRR